MNNKLDELAKGLAQSATRRQALKKFGVGLAGMVVAGLGLANRAEPRGVAKKCGKVCAGCGPGLPPCCEGLVCDGFPGFCSHPGIPC